MRGPRPFRLFLMGILALTPLTQSFWFAQAWHAIDAVAWRWPRALLQGLWIVAALVVLAAVLDMLWGHRNDPVNFHRCLQDFDRRLPDLLDALRPGDLLILTSDHGCDPTTPSTDHSREHALLLAYVEGKNADGALHQGEFADVGATVSAWLGGKAPSRGIPGQPIASR